MIFTKNIKIPLGETIQEKIKLYFDIVNCNDIKILIDRYNKYCCNCYYIYYCLDKNILKINYSDTKENVNEFTSKQKEKIKKKCLQVFLKEYNKIKDSEYKKQQIELINKNLKEL